MNNSPSLSPTGYQLNKGNTRDRALLLEFLERTYQSLFPEQGSFPHLPQTIESYFSWRSPLWWVRLETNSQPLPKPIAGLWLGNAIDQVTGDRHGHIFMLYVDPDHRRRGIATALLNQAQQWGQERGDRRLGLQVFTHNPGAIALYEKLGFTPRALLLEKKW
jgi:ribosomal protein S18 acetylase RimI-like enzyme